MQTLPSLQAVPFATAVDEQWPAVHVSVVQAFPSLHWLFVVQAAQPAIAACAQPVLALQISVVQAFPSSHLSAVPAVQAPL